MTHPCARALRFCALLALPASASAQSTRSATIFSPSSQLGMVTIKAAVVLTDYTVKPLPLLDVVARRVDRPDSVSGKTDLEGRVSMSLGAGAYTLHAKAAQPIGGRSYVWAVRVVVRPARTEVVQLTNSNAMRMDSVPPAPVAAPVVVAAPPPANTFSVPAATTPNAPTPNAPTPRVLELEAAASKPPRVNTTGLLLGLSLNGSGIRSDDLNSTTESGAGLGAQAGWGFTKNFAFVLDASAARIESVDGNYDLAHVDVSGRWHFVNASNGVVPFVEIGYAGRAATKKDALVSNGAGTVYPGDLTIYGGGVSFGGGLEYFVTPRWALGGSLKWTTGQFTSVRVDNVTVDGFAIDATSGQFNMGFAWYPMGRGR